MSTFEPAATEILKTFMSNWGSRVESIPSLKLDGTWPSIGTIDLFTFGCRLQKESNTEIKALVRGSAAYIASVLAKCWDTIAPNVVVGNDSQDGIYLKASGGEFIAEGDSLYLPVEKALRDVLRNLPDPFPILRSSKRRISFDSNVVSLFGIGSAFGLSPYVEGPWTSLSFKDLKKPLQEISKELATQTADYYARVFPNEPLGSVAELYLSSLIFPPPFVGEALPGKQAVEHVLGFCEKYSVSKSQLHVLARNWAQLPDDTLSSVGLVFYAATLDGKPTPELVAVAQSKANITGLLREAMLAARKGLEGDEFADWAVTGIITERLVHHFDVEENLLFNPWLLIPKERLVNPDEYQKYRELVLALCAYEYEEAVRACDKILEESPADIDFRLQRIKLEMLNGDWDKTDGMFRGLLSETGADENPLFFHLWTLTCFARGDSAHALKYARAALAVAEDSDPLKSELYNNCGWAELLEGQVDQALDHFNQALETSNCPLTILLNKAHTLWRLNREPEAAEVRRKLLALAPWDRRVFGSIMAAKKN